jgi:hypothetical protein
MLKEMQEIYDYLQAKTVLLVLTDDVEYEIKMSIGRAYNYLAITVFKKPARAINAEFKILFATSGHTVKIYNPELVVKMYSVGVDRTKKLTLDDLYRAFDAVWKTKVETRVWEE